MKSSPLLCFSLIISFLFTGCGSDDEVIAVQSRRSPSFYNHYGSGTSSGYSYTPSRPSYTASRSSYSSPSRSANSLLSEVRLQRDILSMSTRGRTGKRMSPRYITIHSTQNWSRGADALRHSLALKRSKLGRISWHYTTDDKRAVQHLPTSEQGNHADHDGPGNRYSIGIEMCEHPGNSRGATIDRTAKLTAYLMAKHNIPLSRVVPHYKWPRWGKKPPNKNCPHFLLSNGKPGAKWQGYLARVNRYYNQIKSRPSYASLDS